MKHFSIKLLSTISFLVILCSCGASSGPSKPDLTPVSLTLAAAKNLNPDIEQIASPLVIRIYQLTQIDTFNNNDFFALYENDQTLLANDLQYREELEIQPKQLIQRILEIYPETHFIAVLAAYRNLDKAQWKSFIEIDPVNLESLQIDLHERAVAINPTIDK